MELANQSGKTADRRRSIALGVWLLGAAALTACGGGGGSADGAGIGAGPAADSGPAPTAPAKPSSILFAGDNGKTGTELFRTDGTAAGTVLVKDINTNTQGSNPQNRVVMGAVTYFTVTNGQTLWKSDGTAAGTVMVKNINPTSTTSGNLQELTVVGSTLYFSVSDAEGNVNRELWKTDGTAAGTVMVRDRSHGVGLGLAIARRFVGLMQGQLRLRSALGEGTCMVVFLPKVAPVALLSSPDDESWGHLALPCKLLPVPEVPPLQVPQAPRSAIARTGRAILLVEDDALVSQAIGHLFESLQLPVLIAADTQAARDVSRQAFVVACDVRLPGETSGLNLAVELQTGLAISCLLMTGETGVEIRAAAQLNGL